MYCRIIQKFFNKYLHCCTVSDQVSSNLKALPHVRQFLSWKKPIGFACSFVKGEKPYQKDETNWNILKQPTIKF